MACRDIFAGLTNGFKLLLRVSRRCCKAIHIIRFQVCASNNLFKPFFAPSAFQLVAVYTHIDAVG